MLLLLTADAPPLPGRPAGLPGGIQVLQGLWASGLLVLQALAALCSCLAQLLMIMNHSATSQAVCGLSSKQTQPPQVVLQPLADLISCHSTI